MLTNERLCECDRVWTGFGSGSRGAVMRNSPLRRLEAFHGYRPVVRGNSLRFGCERGQPHPT